MFISLLQFHVHGFAKTVEQVGLEQFMIRFEEALHQALHQALASSL
jgi:hypothetical protein